MEVGLRLHASGVRTECSLDSLFFEFFESVIYFLLLEVVVRMSRLQADSAGVDLCIGGDELGDTPLEAGALLLREVLESRLVHVFVADVEDEVDLSFFAEALDQRFQKHFLKNVA